MPGTLSQLVVFVSLGVPGLVWLVVRERRLPRWTRTVLRETAEFVTVSALADAVGLALALGILASVSSLHPTALLADPAEYYRSEPVLSATWLGLGLVIATILSALAAIVSRVEPRLVRGRRNNFPPWYFAFRPKPPPTTSGYDGVLEIDPHEPSTLVVCRLDDGTEIAGLAGPYADEPGLEGKRDIVLLRPCIKWPEGTNRADGALRETEVVVNEQRIRWFTTTSLTAEASRRYVATIRAALLNPQPARDEPAGPTPP